MTNKLFNLITGEMERVDFSSTDMRSFLPYVPASQHIEFLMISKNAQNEQEIRNAILKCTENELTARAVHID